MGQIDLLLAPGLLVKKSLIVLKLATEQEYEQV